MAITTPQSDRRPVYAYLLGDALYLNLTSACTLACVFCPKIRDGDWRVGGFDLRLARPPTAEESWQAALAAGIQGRAEVVFTGFGEPTRRLEVLLEVARRLKDAGVQRVRVDTDGLASLREGRDVVPELRAAGVDALSVSINAPDAATYVKLCPNVHGERAWSAACDFISRAARAFPDVAASCIAMPGLSRDACEALVQSMGARFRWRPYDRMGRVDRDGAAAGADIPSR